MSRPLQNVHYLTVNVEDYDRLATAARRQRLCRSVSPDSGSFARESTADTPPPTVNRASSYAELSVPGNPARWGVSGSCNDLPRMESSGAPECGPLSKAHKKLHRRTHITEAYHRSRSNTDPGAKPDRPLRIPILTIPAALRSKRPKSDGRALSSLVEQTVQLTSASVGLPSRTASAIDLSRPTLSTPPLAPSSTPHLLAPSSLSSLTTASREGRDACRRFSRSTSSVSTLMQLNSEQLMAPLQSCAETHSVTALHATNQAPTTFVKRHSNSNDCSDDSPKSNVSSGSVLDQSQQQQGKAKGIFSKQLSVQSDYSSSINESFQSLNTLGNTIKQQDNRSLRHSSSSGNFLNPLVPVSSTSSVRSLSPSRKSVASGGGNTAKHEQSSSAAATPPPEKEKKRKEVSSSRVKKFHRHFSQVSKDEKLINYFSCALVSDILLQGHLYITDQHFAFYSNVFGYVTKVVIPTSSVTKISKEKTAKIIPNAVGVATADERHVFGSFISRESAFRLMCSVCPPLAPIEPITKISQGDIEISEYSIEDDSSCSISGNESPPQTIKCAGMTPCIGEDGSQPMMRRTILSSSANKATSSGKDHFNEKFRHSDIPSNAKSSSSSSPGSSAAVRSSMPANAHLSPAKESLLLDASSVVGAHVVAAAVPNITMIIGGSASSTTTSGSASPTPSTSSLPTTVMAKPKSAARAAVDSIKSLSRQTLTRLKFPTDLYVVYLGVLLSVVLALFSVFLLYRILDIEAKTSRYHSSVDFNWGSASDDDIFSEALRWQKQLQSKSSEEAQDILNTNLQQIAKVRRSLETLSMLIHDRSSAYAPAQSDDRD